VLSVERMATRSSDLTVRKRDESFISISAEDLSVTWLSISGFRERYMEEATGVLNTDLDIRCNLHHRYISYDFLSSD
jgi:hypothetical protein